jgi:hypothetical protein
MCVILFFDLAVCRLNQAGSLHYNRLINISRENAKLQEICFPIFQKSPLGGGWQRVFPLFLPPLRGLVTINSLRIFDHLVQN